VEDAKHAIDVAYEAQKSWEKLPPIQRAKYMRSIAQKIRERREHIARVITEEEGKLLKYAQAEVDKTADYIDYMAEWARRIEGEIIPSDRANENILLYWKPVGVVVGILPWNSPFFLFARKMDPAMIAGDTIVIKPSSETPINAYEFAKAIHDANIPKGVVNVITGKGSVVGNSLVTSDKIGLISVTGSTEAGSQIMRAAAKNITKLSLELGGKAPAIVMNDADLENTVNWVKMSRIVNSGQVCNCAERVYVQEDMADKFINKISKAMSDLKVGNPLKDLSVDMGPLISRDAQERVASMIEEAVSSGGKVRTGGKEIKIEGKGFFVQPTVISEVPQSSEIMQREIFGPVLPIATFSTLDEAIEMANDSSYGLTSSIYTQNVDTAMRAVNELKYGETYVNRENGEAMQGFHSGWRKSGLGGDDGKHGLYEFMNTHVVYVQYK
jgi:lactaldehyde dehydrogenase/glycolaldehyde dehydrogenase